MIENVKKAYFNWVCYLAFPNEMDRWRYGLLLDALASTAFIFTIPLDENRMSDGIDLRYKFCYENKLSNEVIEGEFDMQSCSILEMMVALALRCDEHIMFDSDLGGRTNIWFLEMLKSLELDRFTEYSFDECLYSRIIDRFLNRQYEWNGLGGLFTIKNPKTDMRNVEIWYQMCWYLDELLKKY